MNPCASSFPDGAARSVRLQKITRAADELSRCVAERGKVEPGNEMGLTVGELDWLTELERLLYEDYASR